MQRKAILLDENWPSYLTKLQEKFTVFGLTKMDVGKFVNIASMEKWRYLELKTLGIQFSTNNDLPSQSMKGAIFYQGIFYWG